MLDDGAKEIEEEGKMPEATTTCQRRSYHGYRDVSGHICGRPIEDGETECKRHRAAHKRAQTRRDQQMDSAARKQRDQERIKQLLERELDFLSQLVDKPDARAYWSRDYVGYTGEVVMGLGTLRQLLNKAAGKGPEA